MNVFYLKQVISALMIVVDLLYFSIIHLFIFTCIFNKSVYVALRLKRRKNYERLVFSFYFVSSVLNVIVFDYNGLKQSLILQTKQTRLLPFVILRCMWRDLGISLALY